MNNQMNEPMSRKEMLNMIDEISFSLIDTQLYLDTHPCDTDAIAYFEECSRIRNQALRDYANCFGPLTIDTVTSACNDRWSWVNEPWPWQEGGC